MTNEERPEADIPQESEAASRNDVLRPRALPARLARGGQFSTSLARTITQGPKPVLGNIASARTEPMLTVQSKLPPARPSVARTPQPAIAREPEAAPAAVDASAPRPVAPELHDDGGIFGGIARFVLRRLKPRREQDNDDEPSAPPPAAPAPAAAPIARTAAPAPAVEAPELPAPTAAHDHDETEHAAPVEAPIARAPEAETTAPSVLGPIAREASDKSAEAPRFELARRPMTPQSTPESESAAADPQPAAPTLSVETPTVESAPIARIERTPDAPAPETPATAAVTPAAPTPEVAPAAPVISRVEASHEHETPEEHAAHTDEAPQPAPVLRAREESPIANLALAIRRVFRAPAAEEVAPEAVEAPAIAQEATTEAASPAVISREETPAPLEVAAEDAPESPAPMLARFAVLRDEAADVQPEHDASRVTEEPEVEAERPSLEAASEPLPFTQRVMRLFRPRAPEEAAPVASSTAASPTPITTPTTTTAAPGPIARVAAAPAFTPQTPAAAETMSPLTLARMQLAPLSRSRGLDELESEEVASEPASTGGDLVLRQASSPQKGADAGPAAPGSFAPAAPITLEIQREASTPLIYRRSAFAAPPSSAGGFDPAFEGGGMGVEQVLREIERGGMTSRQTLVASAAIIQSQLDGTAGGGGTDEASAAAPAEGAADAAVPAASAATPAASAAAATPADATAAMSNQVLEKLAREIFDRLRRRLVVERERAGIGTAMS